MKEERLQTEPAVRNKAAQGVERRYGRGYFTATRIAKLAMFTAIAYILTFLEFPVFPAAPFLKLDFSLVFIALAGFCYGPLAAVIVCGAKECLSLLDTTTAGVGELANVLITLSFVLLPAFVYRYKKGFGVAVSTLAVSCVLMIAVGLLSNRYINFPLYMGEGAKESFAALWWYIALFNLIKGVAVSILTILLYKRISWLLNKF